MLDVANLSVGFEGTDIPVLEGLTFAIADGETVGMVGESGSGKSLTALSLMRLLPHAARVLGGRIAFDSHDVLAMSAARLNRLRGGEMAMLFQQPLAMLDPTATVGSQVAEAVRRHNNVGRSAAWGRAVELLREVGIPAPEIRARQYAYQLSGGMAQRVMTAAALAGDPRLLIADEPTTALDVTVQLQILQLLARERQARRLSTLLITHDLGVVSALADRVLVMYAGRIVEEGRTRSILEQPQHPYTQALVRSSLLRTDASGALFSLAGSLDAEALSQTGCRFVSRCVTAAARGLHAHCSAHEPVLAAISDDELHRVRCCAPGPMDATAGNTMQGRWNSENGKKGVVVSLQAVSKHYPLRRNLLLRSVDNVNLEIRQGEVLGLVGESGCGKSTLARLLLRLAPTSGGTIWAMGHGYEHMRTRELRQLRRDAQLIFQDPYNALDPKLRLGDSLMVPLNQNRIGTPHNRREMVLAMIRDVGLEKSVLDRRPRECSGGQLQRAVIARALLMGPRLLICDEPTSALDASIRAQIINLLGRLRDTHNLTMLFISHDLRVVRHICNRVAVMYLGEIVETATTAALFARPAHPYTQALIAASLLAEHGLAAASGQVRGEPPSPLALPRGCRFITRCSHAVAQCSEHPSLEDVSPERTVRCWRHAELPELCCSRPPESA